MTVYGSFQHDTQNNTFTGRMDFGGFKAQAKLIPNPDKTDRADDKAPDYLLMDGNARIGAGWKKVAEASGNRYVSLKIDTPLLPNTIWCKLSKTKNTGESEYLLFWSR